MFLVSESYSSFFVVLEKVLTNKMLLHNIYCYQENNKSKDIIISKLSYIHLVFYSICLTTNYFTRL